MHHLIRFNDSRVISRRFLHDTVRLAERSAFAPRTLLPSPPSLGSPLTMWQVACTFVAALICCLVLVVAVIKCWMVFQCIRHSVGRRVPHRLRSAADGTVRILSLNLFLRSRGVYDAGTPDDWKASRLDEFLCRYLVDYDVVCLQEVFGVMSTLCARLLDRAEQMGFHWRVVPEHPPMLSRKFMDSGLVILSRFPILHTETRMFRSGTHADKLAAKSFQYCTIDLSSLLDGVPCGETRALGTEMCASPHLLHVINTHLQSDYQVLDVAALEVKFQQLQQIRDFMNERDLHASLAPLLLAGDFNINATVWSPELTVVPHQVSHAYLRAMRILGFHACHDVLRPTGLGGRAATAFCTYERTGARRELDSRRRDPDDHELRANPSWVNLARSVDYMWFVPPNTRWLRLQLPSVRIEKFPMVDPANKIGGCSDHYGIGVTLEVNKTHACCPNCVLERSLRSF